MLIFSLIIQMVAVKVIKNHSAYFNQAKMEIFILKSVCLADFPGIRDETTTTTTTVQQSDNPVRRTILINLFGGGV